MRVKKSFSLKKAKSKEKMKKVKKAVEKK